MRFVVVSEAAADFTLATELADRVFVAEIEWLEEELLECQYHPVFVHDRSNHGSGRR